MKENHFCYELEPCLSLRINSFMVILYLAGGNKAEHTTAFCSALALWDPSCICKESCKVLFQLPWSGPVSEELTSEEER